MTERYFEDYPPGAVFTSGAMSVSAADIIDFAGKYDPHVTDGEGGLIYHQSRHADVF